MTICDRVQNIFVWTFGLVQRGTRVKNGRRAQFWRYLSLKLRFWDLNGGRQTAIFDLFKNFARQELFWAPTGVGVWARKK